jgi:hypothetical protein
MNLFVSLRYLVALDEHRHFGRAALASKESPGISSGSGIRACGGNSWPTSTPAAC